MSSSSTNNNNTRIRRRWEAHRRFHSAGRLVVLDLEEEGPRGRESDRVLCLRSEGPC